MILVLEPGSFHGKSEIPELHEGLMSLRQIADLKKVTEKHLDEFASQGLRTLTLAYKVIGGGLFAF